MNRFSAKDRKQIDRERYLKNREKILAQCAAYRAANREYYREMSKFYRDVKAGRV